MTAPKARYSRRTELYPGFLSPEVEERAKRGRENSVEANAMMDVAEPPLPNSKTTASQDLSGTQPSLKKLRRGVHAVMAANRFKASLSFEETLVLRWVVFPSATVLINSMVKIAGRSIWPHLKRLTTPCRHRDQSRWRKGASSSSTGMTAAGGSGS